jgi:hypothetical protein
MTTQQANILKEKQQDDEIENYEMIRHENEMGMISSASKVEQINAFYSQT